MLTNCGGDSNGDTPTAAEEEEAGVWHDTLTNAASTFAELEPMDRRISRFMGKWDLRGISVAITRHDSLLFAKGYGLADAEGSVPMAPNMVMRIASSSKLITATAIMRLCEEGKISLDSKVLGANGILNDTLLTNVITDQRIFDITIDHLLTHMGGFATRAGDPMTNTRELMIWNNLTTAPRGKDVARIVLHRRLMAEPGSMRSYSNFGYMLLSLVVEKISGKNYFEYVMHDVLGRVCPGGFLPATNYLEDRYPYEPKYYAPDNVLVEEYNRSGRMVPRAYGGIDVYGLMGAGGWTASAPALARLVAAIDGDPKVPDILSAQSIAKMTEYSEEYPVCRGWTMIEKDGSWLRTGTLYTTHSFIKHFPDGECWVITMNTGVYIGPSFMHPLNTLVESLRAEFSPILPKQDLWK